MASRGGIRLSLEQLRIATKVSNYLSYRSLNFVHSFNGYYQFTSYIYSFAMHY